ncbi:unnamed protein product [Euphydryas editha]|uniref:Reverse transcriptase n=1 Tax=Euphydryas editha TaxID=104508 RepID=A0AAU9V2M3_EUPED|nr:unnamed protein product [Euphydryas editha]
MDLSLWSTLRDPEYHRAHVLDGIVNWCGVNTMTLNPGKCYDVMFTRNDKVLQELPEIKDLGVTIDGRLTFKTHIDSIIRKVARCLGFIRRNTEGFSQATKIIIYNALVRSHIEFASVVWILFHHIGTFIVH